MALNFKKLTAGEPRKTANIFGSPAFPQPEPEKNLIQIESKGKPPVIEDLKKQVIVSKSKDANDHIGLRHGKKVHEGTDYSMFIQSPPMLYTREGHNLWLGDMYRGATAFLICNGPSFGSILDLEIDFKGKKRTGREILNYPGFVTMGVNNGPRSFRPNLWTCVDTPSHFIKSIWLDPKIMKFVPFSFPDRQLFDNEKWVDMDTTVGECPNMVYYKRNEHFAADQFLFEDTFNWGNHKDYGGGRSVMLVAIRMLYHLGIRTVFLLGADLNMSENQKYHFEQERSKGSISGNNSTYKMLNERFDALKPIFEKYGFKVFNCNLDSKLHSFPKIKFEDAVEIAGRKMPQIETERTEGLYDREANKKSNVKTNKINRDVIKAAKNYTEQEKLEAKKKLDTARATLTLAKDNHSKTPTPELEKAVIEARAEFRKCEEEKNRIWGIVKKK